MRQETTSQNSPTYSTKTIRQAGLSADTTYSLAEGKFKDGRLGDALNLYNETLRLQREQFGRNDPQVARTLNDIAVTLSNMGEAYEVSALQTFREALLIQRRILPIGDKDTAVTAKNMSILIDELNKKKGKRPQLHPASYDIS